MVVQALGDAGYSRIGPSPAWPQGHYLSCHLHPVVQGCGRASLEGQASSTTTHLWLGPTHSLHPGLSHPWPV